MLREAEANHALSQERRAAFVYLAFSLDKLLNFNSRMTRWIPQREVMAGTFDTHDFALIDL
jgi:adenine-specific DNA methylase